MISEIFLVRLQVSETFDLAAVKNFETFFGDNLGLSEELQK